MVMKKGGDSECKLLEEIVKFCVERCEEDAVVVSCDQNWHCRLKQFIFQNSWRPLPLPALPVPRPPPRLPPRPKFEDCPPPAAFLRHHKVQCLKAASPEQNLHLNLSASGQPGTELLWCLLFFLLLVQTLQWSYLLHASILSWTDISRKTVQHDRYALTLYLSSRCAVWHSFKSKTITHIHFN